MTHFIDLTTEQLYDLKNLLSTTKSMPILSKKLDLHIAVAETSKSKN